MAGAFLTASLLGLVLCAWMLWQNERTSRERQRLIDFVFGFPIGEYRAFVALYEQVSYDQHFWSRVLFRDPRNLYAPALWEALS